MRKVILVIENNKDMRQILCFYLSILGDFKIHEASDEREALELFHEVSPDLVFLDLYMPQMNGTQTLKALRARQNGRKVPVVVWTVCSEEEVGDVRGAGFDAYLCKSSTRRAPLKGLLEKMGILPVEGSI